MLLCATAVKQADNFLLFCRRFYTEGVGQSQPRVCFETLGQRGLCFSHNPERVRQIALNYYGNEPFQGSNTFGYLIPGLPKLNPGLELANTFGVIETKS
jgi:hypothetical protein